MNRVNFAARTGCMRLGGLLLCLLAVPALGSSTAPRKPYPVRRTMATVWGWTTAPWNGDDRPYQRIRATIDNAVAGGRKPQELMYFYEASALKNPNDPQAQFRWAYAAYKAALTVDYYTGESILSKPRDALVLGPFPHTYEYVRLIFLTEDYAEMFVTQLLPVGKRLLLRNPNDLDVKYAVAGDLMFSRSQADRQTALIYVEQLIRTEPERPHPRALLGLFYYRQWRVSRSKDDAYKAISSYEQYLQRAPAADAVFIQQVKEKIVEMQKG